MRTLVFVEPLLFRLRDAIADHGGTWVAILVIAGTNVLLYLLARKILATTRRTFMPAALSFLCASMGLFVLALAGDYEAGSLMRVAGSFIGSGSLFNAVMIFLKWNRS